VPEQCFGTLQAGGRKERPIRRAKGRPRDIAPKNRELVAKYDDLELLEVLGAPPKRDELEHASQGDVQERKDQSIS